MSAAHERMKVFYEGYWQHRINSHYIHTRDGMWIPERIHAMLRLIGSPTRSLKVLDVGCGEGTAGKLLKEKYANKVHLTGIDISNTALTMARNFYDKVVEFDADSESLSQILPQKRFDCIIAMEMLEHLFNPKRVLEQFSLVLEKDGCVIVSVPNMVHWRYRLQYLRGHLPGENTLYEIGEHLQNFTYFSFKKLVESTGYSVLALDGQFQIPLGRIMPKTVFRFLGQNLPNLFGYQIVLKLKKNTN